HGRITARGAHALAKLTYHFAIDTFDLLPYPCHASSHHSYHRSQQREHPRTVLSEPLVWCESGQHPQRASAGVRTGTLHARRNTGPARVWIQPIHAKVYGSAGSLPGQMHELPLHKEHPL
ncbi:hypothetical protein PRIPAC_90957, partial [Pristionchus pacificus]